MSVKISRREEKRDTSIRDFSLAAVLPLLLSGLIGFFLGQTDKVDSTSNNLLLASAQDSLTTLQAQLNARRHLVVELDSLLIILTESNEKRKAEFSQVAATEATDILFDSPLDLWISAVTSDYTRMRGAVSELEGRVTGNTVLQRTEVKPLFDMFRHLNQQSNNYLQLRLNAFRGQTSGQRENTEALVDVQDDCDQQIERLQAELQILERRLENKELDIERLKTKLADTGDEDPITPVSFQMEKSAIMEAVMEIESISRQLPSGILTSNKKTEEVEARILRQTGLIKNALAVIE